MPHLLRHDIMIPYLPALLYGQIARRVKKLDICRRLSDFCPQGSGALYMIPYAASMCKKEALKNAVLCALCCAKDVDKFTNSRYNDYL